MDFDWGSFFGDVAKSAIGAGTSALIGGALSRSSNKQGEKASKQALQNQQQANELTALQSDIAREQWDRYREIYEPAERQLVAEALKTSSPEAYAKAAGEASATVASQFGKARSRMGRTPGLDPSSGAYQSAMMGLDLAQAATDATQQNMARKGVEDTGYARRVAAVGMGKGLDNTAANGLAAGSNALRSSAGLNQASAGQNYNQALSQAQMGGAVVNRFMQSPTLNSWLGNIGKLDTSYIPQSSNNSHSMIPDSSWMPTPDPVGYMDGIQWGA